MQHPVPQEIAALNELGEAEAWQSFYSCAPKDFAERYRVETHRIGSLRLFMAAGMPRAFFNRIIGAGLGAPATEPMLDEALGILREAGCRNYMVQVIPSAEPPELPAWLEGRGLARGRSWAKVYRDNRPPPPVKNDLRIEPIGRESGEVFADVVLAAFRMPGELAPFIRAPIGEPGWSHYLAYDNDLAVSAATMYVRKGIGWLGLGSTLESHRGRGGQGALFARRIADGIASGCRWFVTETGEETPEKPNPSYRNMLRAGFRLAYVRENYILEEKAG